MAATRLNRYLALAGLGTRRSVEGLVRAGRVAVDGIVADEPSTAVEPGATRHARRPAGRRGRPGRRPRRARRRRGPRARPSERAAPGGHLAGRPPRRADQRRATCRRLRALGYDPGRLGGAHPQEGGFRPLDDGELDAARGLARAAQRANARARGAEPNRAYLTRLDYSAVWRSQKPPGHPHRGVITRRCSSPSGRMPPAPRARAPTCARCRRSSSPARRGAAGLARRGRGGARVPAPGR